MRPFQIGPGHTGYNLDRCEEVILIDAFARIKPKVPPEEHWVREFETRFFKDDKGVSGKVLEAMDRHLKRLHIDRLNFQISDWTPYMRIRGDEKIDARMQILRGISGPDRAHLIAVARKETILLPKLIEEDGPAEPDWEELARRHRQEALERAHKAQVDAMAEIKSVKEATGDLIEAVRDMERLFAGLGAIAKRVAGAATALDQRFALMIDKMAEVEESRLQTEAAIRKEERQGRSIGEAAETRPDRMWPHLARVAVPGAEQPDISHLNGHAFDHDARYVSRAPRY